MCLLRISLYGLKQTPHQWYKKFDMHLVESDFIKSKQDSCVFIYLVLYVSDILIVCNNKAGMALLKKKMSLHFEMKDLAQARKILGKINKTRNHKAATLTLSQHDSKPVKTPIKKSG